MPSRQTRGGAVSAFGLGWAAAALLLPGVAMPLVAAAQDAPLQLVSTPWSPRPFTNVPGQPRFASIWSARRSSAWASAPRRSSWTRPG